MNRKQLIYVENIPSSTKEDQLQAYLEKSAPILQVIFLREKQCTKRSVAAFVRLANEADVPLLLARNQQNFRGKRLFMVPTNEPQQFKADLTVIVRNIHQKITEETLFDHFEDCGKIEFLQIRTDDFAYICFEDKTAVRHAMAKNNVQLKGSALKVQILTRNVDIMIVNLDTLPNRMPELYRQLSQPVAPRTNAGQQAVPEPMDQDPPLNQAQIQRSAQQQQKRPQQNQPQVSIADKLKEKANLLSGKQLQQQQNNNVPQQQRQQNQQQNQQRQQNQQQQQRQQNQQQQQNQQRQQQQNQQKQQQQLNQQKQQQQQNQQKQQQQQNQQKQQQLQQNQKRQQQQQQPQQRQQPQKQQATQAKQTNGQASKPQPAPNPVETVDFTVDDDSVEFKADGMAEDVEIVEDAIEIVDLEEVEIEEESNEIPPIPSAYTPKPTDYLRPIKASELNLTDVELKSPGDRCAVWVNNIQPETRRLDLARYMEQFGNIESFKVGTSKACFFTNWAKVKYCDEESADRAAEYFLHPFRGQYLFVLSCKKAVEEVPEKCFVIDYLSKYITYEDVVRAFKPVGEVFYMVRLYNNTAKVRIFFVKNVNTTAVLAVKTVDGCPIKVETYAKDMDLKIPKAKMIQYKEARDIITSRKAARIARIYEVAKQEAHDRTNNKVGYVNPDVKKNPVEITIYNVPKTIGNDRITEFLKSIGEPTGIRREPELFDELAEQVYVGFSTLSKALAASQMTVTETLGGHTPFIFTAWTIPAMKDDNTVKLRFETGSNPTIQAIHDGMAVYGAVRYVSKTAADQATVVFKRLNQAVLKATTVQQIGNVKVICAEKYNSNSFITKSAEPAIVIDDDDEVVVVTSDVPANKGKPNQDQQKPKQQNNQKPQQQRQQNQQRQNRPQQQNQREPSPSQELRQMFNQPNRNIQNNNQQFQQQRGQQFRMQQQQPFQDQRGPINPWNQLPDPEIRPYIREGPRDQFRPNNNGNQFRQNNPQNNNFNQFNRFGPGGPGGNPYGQNELFNRDRPHPMDTSDFGMRRDNFNRGGGPPMFDDEPQFDRFGDPIPPWRRQQSPFERMSRNDDDDFGNIPANIPEEDLDEYIMRKQEMIKRRLEQLDKQLICSVENSRQHDLAEFGSRRRGGSTVISHTGDVHFVPNPVAVARNRNNNHNNRGRNNQGGPQRNLGGAGRPNIRKDQPGGRSNRTRDPFEDIEMAPILKDRDGSPSPKRNRDVGPAEAIPDNFADRFNAAWS